MPPKKVGKLVDVPGTLTTSMIKRLNSSLYSNTGEGCSNTCDNGSALEGCMPGTPKYLSGVFLASLG